MLNQLHVGTMVDEDKRDKLEISVMLRTVNTGQTVKVKALLDSGATGLFLDEGFVKEMQWEVDDMEKTVPVYNVDGTLNAAGHIQQTIDLFIRYGEHQERATFSITKLGGTQAILGHAWLKRHNPKIDWKTGAVELT